MKRSGTLLSRLFINQVKNPRFISTSNPLHKSTNSNGEGRMSSRIGFFVGAAVAGGVIGATKMMFNFIEGSNSGFTKEEVKDKYSCSCAGTTLKDCKDSSTEFFTRHCSTTMDEMSPEDMNLELKKMLKKATKGYGSSGRRTHTVVISDVDSFFNELQETAQKNKEYPATIVDPKAQIRDLITTKGYTVLLFTWDAEGNKYTCERITGVHLLITFIRRGGNDNPNWCPYHFQDLMIVPLQKKESLRTDNSSDLPIYTVTPIGNPHIHVTVDPPDSPPSQPSKQSQEFPDNDKHDVSRLSSDSNVKEPGPSLNSQPVGKAEVPESEQSNKDGNPVNLPGPVSTKGATLDEIPGPSRQEGHKLAVPQQPPGKGKKKSITAQSPRKGNQKDTTANVEQKKIFYVSPKRDFIGNIDGDENVKLCKSNFYLIHAADLRGGAHPLLIVDSSVPGRHAVIEANESAVWLICSSCKQDLQKIFINDTCANKKIQVRVTSTCNLEEETEMFREVEQFNIQPIIKPAVDAEGLVLEGFTGKRWEYILLKVGKQRGYFHAIHVTPICPVCKNPDNILLELYAEARKEQLEKGKK